MDEWEFLGMLFDAVAPWGLVSLTILLVAMSHDRDRNARRKDDDDAV